MKKFVLTIKIAVVLLVTTTSFSQIINFPDANFKTALLSLGYIDTNGNGEIEVTEALNVTGLNISNRNISNLSGIEFFAGSTFLNFSQNQITTIDLTNLQNLQSLDCSNNLLSSINISGLQSLSIFHGYNNLLTEIDFSSNPVINYANLNNNQLLYINMKNGFASFNFYFGNNPNLNNVCCDFFETTDIQYMLNQNGQVNCHISSFCEPTFPYPLSIQGVFKYDNSVNGCDTNDPIINDVKLKVDRQTIILPFYTFNSEPLEAEVPAYYTLTPFFENTGYFTSTPSQASFNFYQSSVNSFSQDFCITPNGIHNDLEVVLLPISDAIPGSNTTYKLVYKNKGTHTQSGNLSLNVPSNLTFISSSINPSSQSINQIVWSFTDLLPFESREISLTLNLDAAVGTVLNFSTSISSSNVDQTPADNIFQLKQTAIASPIANTISCLQGASIQTSQVGNYVHYLIRFKNNTQQVVNSIGITTNMFNIDHNTIIPISASHQYTASIKEAFNYITLEIKFQNIALPINNGGYIAFKIKTFPNLVTGNNFKNTAKIFFNNDAPIVTNTATTYVGTVLSTDNFEKNDTLIFYPNPAQNIITFNQEVKTVSIYTLDGKLLNTQLINNQIDLSGFNPGIYLVRGTTNNGISFSEKLVKN
jgi:hypothetical protein